ncbi:CLUMA_CG013861, isoform A [Clunio marinus]|uniref:CLUMA_CG013861, isoform A n=1 Tax=Clunio marinus TaxID=568069 RepID=A0A1J1IQ20_9DIPT|nr:CLUMA_CG013861, isoform A [Clunio marinus]
MKAGRNKFKKILKQNRCNTKENPRKGRKKGMFIVPSHVCYPNVHRLMRLSHFSQMPIIFKVSAHNKLKRKFKTIFRV